MKRRVIILISLSAGLGAGLHSDAATPDPGNNPFTVIVTRNVFGLKPPPPPPGPVEAVLPPPPKITLLGIVNVFGVKKVILKTVEPPGRPVQPGQDAPFTLSEREAQREVEVLEIDESAGSVKVVNHGTPMTLTFEKDGLKLPAGLAPGVPGVPVIPGVPAPMPVRPGVPAPITSTPMGGVGAMNPGMLNPAATTVNPAVSPTSLPVRPVRTTEQPLTVEQQIIIMEVERERTKDLVKQGEYPPLPPTELTPAEDQAQPPGVPTLPGPPGFPRR